MQQMKRLKAAPSRKRYIEKESWRMKVILGVVIGGAIGFGIGYFGKCSSGACPLTSNPIISTIVGAIIGFMVTMK